MSQIEYLDILDEQGNLTGKSETSKEVHRLGLKHRAVHVWFLNSQNQLLLQKRSKEKASYPGYWDISAAGHVSTGQTALEAAKRETYEELGLDIPESDFNHLFEIKEYVVLNNGNYIADEFQNVYLVEKDPDTTKMKLQVEEVDEVMWVDLTQLEQWVKERKTNLVPHEEEHARLIEYIRNQK